MRNALIIRHVPYEGVAGYRAPIEEAGYVVDRIDVTDPGFSALDLVEPEGREAELDAYFAAIPVNLRHQGCEAYYEPTPDRVTMPPASLFSGFDHYYATLAHELSHWTGHSSRLARDLKNRFGTAAYAAEELVALSGQSAPCLTHH